MWLYWIFILHFLLFLLMIWVRVIQTTFFFCSFFYFFFHKFFFQFFFTFFFLFLTFFESHQDLRDMMSGCPDVRMSGCADVRGKDIFYRKHFRWWHALAKMFSIKFCTNWRELFPRALKLRIFYHFDQKLKEKKNFFKHLFWVNFSCWSRILMF